MKTTTDTAQPCTYSYLEKQLSKYVRGVTIKCVANYMLYAVATFTVYMYADHMLSQVMYQITSH